MANHILEPFKKGNLTLKNRLVLAPMTRARAEENIPNTLMAEYYSQRSGAGLIITEGTSPDPDGLGYPRIPGIFSTAQIEGWEKVKDAVHAKGSKIFVQVMHTGRIASLKNLPAGAGVVGVSAIKANGQIFTANGMVDFDAPRALTTEEVEAQIDTHVLSAVNAVKAGFDGIELHGANGYLIEQFLNPHVNVRTDKFGGDYRARASFLLEVAGRAAVIVGAEKIGIRISPYSTYNDLPAYDRKEVHRTYVYLAQELNRIGIAYIHISVNSAADPATLEAIRSNFNGVIIHCNGLTPETAQQKLDSGEADLVAFASLFLANPDLDRRIAAKGPFNTPDPATFFSAGPVGYTDYPTL